MSNYVHKDDCKIEVNSVHFQLGSLRMAQFVKIPFIVFRLARSIFTYYLNYCLRTQYTIPTNEWCHETCRVYVYKDDSEIEVLAGSSKNGAIAIGQNTHYSFSSSALNIHGPN